MKPVPRGWEAVSLGDVAETALGKMLDKGRPKGYPHVPYLRNVNVQWGRIDTDNVFTMELAEDERQRFAVVRGDLLVCEGGEVGRAAIWERDGEYMAYQKALHRIRPSDRLDSRFLRYSLEHAATTGSLDPLTTGSTIKHLPQQNLRRLRLLLPPINEQRRIVQILEDHLSRLDAAEATLRASLKRLARFEERSVMCGLGCADGDGSDVARILNGDLPALEKGWSWTTLAEVAEVVGGVTKDSAKQSDPSFVEVPYLRVANVQRARLDLDVITTIRVPPGKAKALALEPGDVLMNEGGDRDKLGRGWVWDGQIPGCIHQNHVYRARPSSEIRSEWLSWCGNTYGARWAQRHGKQSVNLASISLSVIRTMPIVLPPLEIQDQRLALIRGAVAASERARVQIGLALARGEALRRALLAAAFSGRLVGLPADPNPPRTT